MCSHKSHLSQQVCQLFVDLGPEGGTRYVDEGLSVHFPGHLQLFQSSQGFLFRRFKALSNDSWMKTLQQEIKGSYRKKIYPDVNMWDSRAKSHKENMVTVSKRLVLVSLYLRHVEVSLLQELADDEDVRGGSISCDVILRRGNLCNKRGCRVLNLLQMTRKKRFWQLFIQEAGFI